MMQTGQVVLRERCESVIVFARMSEISRLSKLYAGTAGARSLGWAMVGVCMAVGALPAWGQCVEQQKLTASDAATGDAFGVSVSVSDETAVVGAVVDTHSGFIDAGSAYVFVRSQGGVWTQQAKLTASDAASDDRFGGSVSVSGHTAVIGAYYDDDAGSDSGAAYVFSCRPPCVPPPSGMVAWWTLDETAGPTAFDSSGFHNDGTHVNNPTPTPLGKVHGALTFSGSGDHISVPNDISLDPAAGAFSIDLWANILPGSGSNGGLVQKYASSVLVDVGYSFLFNAGVPTLVMRDGTNGHSCIENASSILLQGWHHLAVTVSAPPRQVDFYVDGWPTYSTTVGCSGMGCPSRKCRLEYFVIDGPRYGITTI